MEFIFKKFDASKKVAKNWLEPEKSRLNEEIQATILFDLVFAHASLHLHFGLLPLPWEGKTDSFVQEE